MSMQALGQEGYAERVRAIYETAEQLMTLLETSLEDAETLLVGRFARGLVDGDGPMHVRLYTTRPVHEIAAVLVDQGYDEPAFETADTRRGRLSRVVVTDEGIEFVVTRCPPAMRGDAGKDLFTEAPIAVATREEVRKRGTEGPRD
jgi:glutamate/tyrosine decarboxylase-like PLP-dependent enzyme